MALEKQMELFNEGGLEQDGGTVDPVSGNEVPPGSTQEEVRDDIPAQLSEGEFVFPADVVRYIGLENLMRMRQDAKMGLKMMDKMGQMGNSEEATISDDIPFDLSDLDIEDDLNYNVGGFVPATQQQQQFGLAGTVPSQFAQQPQQPTMPQAPNIPMTPTYVPPQQAEVPVAPTQTTPLTFEQFVPRPTTETVQYINPSTGERRMFTFINGQPTVQIPAGFIPVSEYTPEQVTIQPTVGTTSVRDEEDNAPPQTAEEVAEMRARIDAAKRLGITEQAGFSIAGAFGRYGEDDVGKFTPTGYIIGKGGVLLDPLTGKTREQTSPSMIAGVLDAIAGDKKPPQLAYSDEFFNAMPDQAKDALGRSLGKGARDLRFDIMDERRQSFEDRLRGTENVTRADDITDEERGITTAGVDVPRTSRASLRAQLARERQDEIRQNKNDIATVQAQARAEIASQDTRQQAAERAQREARERQEDRNEGGSGQTLQEKADSYTADRVSEAIATGDFSRGFAEGGLASKPKSKTKKKMKRGGLASKK